MKIRNFHIGVAPTLEHGGLVTVVTGFLAAKLIYSRPRYVLTHSPLFLKLAFSIAQIASKLANLSKTFKSEKYFNFCGSFLMPIFCITMPAHEMHCGYIDMKSETSAKSI